MIGIEAQLTASHPGGRLPVTTIGRSFAMLLVTMLAVMLQFAPADAQLYVASFGNDSAACGPSFNPCSSLQRAHNNALPGAAIYCMDASNYGVIMVITKSISVICDGAIGGSFASPAVTVNAGPDDVISLAGLDIEGAGQAIAGIIFNSGRALHVSKVKVRNYRRDPDSAGIYFQPNTDAELYVTDSYIASNGIAGPLSGGIVISPTGNASANAFINRVQFENNSTGLYVDGKRSTGAAVNAVVRDSVVAGSQGNGVLAETIAGKASVSIFVDGVRAAFNSGSGIRAVGAAASGQGSALIRLNSSVVINNVVGVSMASQGRVESLRNNVIEGNQTDGTPIPPAIGSGRTLLH
jgi:hypothetical protein